MTEGSAGAANRRIDRVLAPDFLADLTVAPLPAIRVRRREAEQEEVDLSYLRRLVQGRVDLLRAEQARRAGNGGDLLAGLVQILAKGEPRGPARGSGRFSTVEPSKGENHRRRIEALIADPEMSDASARTASDLAADIELLTAEERGLSVQRKAVQAVQDTISAEITRRYRSGEADVAALLVVGTKDEG